ncbi:hypothetical protein KBC75_02065 [Candidatus Shapirobacteria bacterium]|nr:hypothetical protein [Candidatus Shapirobacteria bacterium]
MNKPSHGFSIIVYFLGLLASFLLFSLIWHFFVNGRLYICTDPVPFLSFLPPFVHNFSPSADPSIVIYTHDYYTVSPLAIYGVWIAFILAIFLLPWFFVKKFSLLKKISSLLYYLLQ